MKEDGVTSEIRREKGINRLMAEGTRAAACQFTAPAGRWAEAPPARATQVVLNVAAAGEPLVTVGSWSVGW